MRRLLAVTFVWLGFAFVAEGVPSRLPYMPVDPPKPPPAPVLAGTIWRGQIYYANSRIEFLANGKLTYGEPGSTSPGSWRLEGNKLYFQVNDYSEYDTVLLGDVIQGDGVNKAGERCKPLLKRVHNDMPMIMPR